jgi:SAM-dependent methyltransferase
LAEETAFDQYAASYDQDLARGIAVSGEDRTFFARGRIAWLERCLAELGLAPERILDFGCGGGETTALLDERFPGARLVGVDISEPLLARARRTHPGARFEQVNAVAAGERFDLAFLNGVFHHIAEAEQAEAARYLRERLAPGGVLAFWENNPWSPAARYVMSRIAFDRDAVMLWPRRVRGLLRGAGLEVLRTDFLFVFPRLLRALRPLEPRLSRLPLGAQFQVLARRSD